MLQFGRLLEPGECRRPRIPNEAVLEVELQVLQGLTGSKSCQSRGPTTKRRGAGTCRPRTVGGGGGLAGVRAERGIEGSVPDLGIVDGVRCRSGAVVQWDCDVSCMGGGWQSPFICGQGRYEGV